MSQLKKLALAGSADLVPCSEALPLLSRSAIQRLIHRGALPAVKVANQWLTTTKLAQAFWAETLTPKPRTTPVLIVPGGIAEEHERARLVILGK
jgi:hypothetical protein